MELHDLQPAEGSTHRRKVVGRGNGSGHGTTATRGTKGDKARGSTNVGFEGGQTPLHRRLPQLRGFKSRNKKEYALVNVGRLEELFEAGAEVTPEALAGLGLIRDADETVKILGDGSLTKKLTVKAHKFSTGASEKIAAAGGSAETL
jgi:large subunit ribosomal protein L15